MIFFFSVETYVFTRDVCFQGYSFIQAGQNVTVLLRGKGWKELITDDLSDNLLFIVNCAVSCCTGLMGVLFTGQSSHYRLLYAIGYKHPYTAGFVIGATVGFLVSSVILGVIGGAVNAVIVCFAESSVEFHQNHPTHSQKIR